MTREPVPCGVGERNTESETFVAGLRICLNSRRFPVSRRPADVCDESAR